jgi:hypothetical protein
MRRQQFGIRQVSAAFGLVGLGIQFADRRVAIGFALRARDMVNVKDLPKLLEEGERFLAEFGLLDEELTVKVGEGSEVIIKLPATAVEMVAELGSRGLAVRGLKNNAPVVEFRGRVTDVATLARRVEAAGGKLTEIAEIAAISDNAAVTGSVHVSEVPSAETQNVDPPTPPANELQTDSEADETDTEVTVDVTDPEAPMPATELEATKPTRRVERSSFATLALDEFDDFFRIEDFDKTGEFAAATIANTFSENDVDEVRK